MVVSLGIKVFIGGCAAEGYTNVAIEMAGE